MQLFGRPHAEHFSHTLHSKPTTRGKTDFEMSSNITAHEKLIRELPEFKTLQNYVDG